MSTRYELAQKTNKELEILVLEKIGQKVVVANGHCADGAICRRHAIDSLMAVEGK